MFVGMSCGGCLLLHDPHQLLAIAALGLQGFGTAVALQCPAYLRNVHDAEAALQNASERALERFPTDPTGATSPFEYPGLVCDDRGEDSSQSEARPVALRFL